MGSLAQLEKLSLGGNQIGDVGMTAFAEALKPTDKFPKQGVAGEAGYALPPLEPDR